jgi:hypothetical protein
MPRDARTEAIFTTADDQMQGLWGLHHYLKAATDITEPKKLIHRLPQETFPLTHEWGRFYDPREMANEVCQMREFLLCSQSLVSLVTICEAALLRLNGHLSKLGRCAPQRKNMKLLEWAFSVVQRTPLASPEATARLPHTCGDLDNARRLRNCIVHCNGRYDERMYFQQVLQDGWIIPQYEKDSQRAVPAKEPIFLDTERFDYFTCSHIEFLHILHNTIQRNLFGHAIPYNYADEGKCNEWHRILSGRRDVQM